MSESSENPLQYCERKIKEATSDKARKDYADLLALWRSRLSGLKNDKLTDLH